MKVDETQYKGETSNGSKGLYHKSDRIAIAMYNVASDPMLMMLKRKHFSGNILPEKQRFSTMNFSSGKTSFPDVQVLFSV